MRSFPRNMAWVCLVAISLTMFGCGGGGGSSDPDPMDDDSGNGGDTAMEECPGGYARPAGGGDCEPTQDTLDKMAAEAKEKAERVAGLIGPDSDRPDANASDDDGDTPIVSFGTGDDAGQIVFVGDVGLDAEMRFAKTDTAVAEIDDWEGAEYSRTSEDGMTENTVVKYNNKEPNGPQAFATYFRTAGTANGAGYTRGTTYLEIHTGEALDPSMVKIVGDFNHREGVMATTSFVNNGDTEVDESAIDGSLAGLEGTFSCETGTCTVEQDAEGMWTFAGTWIFTPDALMDLTGESVTEAVNALMVQGVVPDPDFLIFGYWLNAVEDDDGTEEELYLPFADGRVDYGSVSSVLGSAKYDGPATGLYMSKSLTSEGAPTHPYSSGQFTADASLTANFGGSGVAVDDQFSITGTISNFRDVSGSLINQNWRLNLMGDIQGRAAENSDGRTPPTENGAFQGTVTAEMLAGKSGTFSGAFYGSNVGTDDQGIETTGVVLPSSAAGTFDGHFTNGHVRGSFGVTR